MAKARSTKITKVLIANRGEIACRVIAACRSLGIKTVAVYSEADAGARHTRLADEAVPIGPGPAPESYLKVDALLEACRKTGAEAIHPGYGFLSERSHFAKAVVDAGLIWIGPSAEVIDLMGNKIAAKLAAEKAKVPTLAWALLKEGWTASDLHAAAKKVGFPLLLKAAAGGGGRGMRRVDAEKEIDEKAESAVREATGAFGSGEIFLEAYCEASRHVEVQVLGDTAGNVIALGERECSVQRRHQKVIEEAPAPSLSDKTRKALWAAGVNLAKAVGYVNAGTCEFLVDKNENFYFLEMNTRLQVEHPVTELVWGVDLPALQLKIAQGEKLPKEGYTPRGHAIEVRLYAEDPAKGFMPSPGKLTAFKYPTLPYLRVDTGYEKGSEVPIYYDAMLAKVIAWGMDREQARHTLLQGLKDTLVSGVAWNGPYLTDILNHKRFVDGAVTTAFLAEDFGAWKGVTRSEAPDEEQTASSAPLAPISPWDVYGEGGGKLRAIRKKSAANRGAAAAASLHQSAGVDGPLVAEHPGKVLKVHVTSGQQVDEGQVLVVCESMKMEFSYSAPFATKVRSVLVKEGQVISAGTTLVEWESAK